MDELTKIALVGTSKYAGPDPERRTSRRRARCGSRGRRPGRIALAGCGRTGGLQPGGASVRRGHRRRWLPLQPRRRRRRRASWRHADRSAPPTRKRNCCSNSCSQMREHEVVLPPELLPLLLELQRRGDPSETWSPFSASGARGFAGRIPTGRGSDAPLQEQTQADAWRLKRTLDEGTIDERCRGARDAAAPMDPRWQRESGSRRYSRAKNTATASSC